MVCHQQMGEVSRAMQIAEEAFKLYPEHTMVLTTLGNLYEQQKKDKKALISWQSAHEINPYDITTQETLIRLYQKQGQQQKVAKHQRYAQILSTGGAIYKGDSLDAE